MYISQATLTMATTIKQCDLMSCSITWTPLLSINSEGNLYGELLMGRQETSWWEENDGRSALTSSLPHAEWFSHGKWSSW